jgi:hypothetical protein
LSSAEVLLDGRRELPADGRRPTWSSTAPSIRLLLDLVASRDERFRFGDVEESGDRDEKEVKTFGDAGTASDPVRLLLGVAVAVWDAERVSRIVLTPRVSILVAFSLSSRQIQHRPVLKQLQSCNFCVEIEGKVYIPHAR